MAQIVARMLKKPPSVGRSRSLTRSSSAMPPNFAVDYQKKSADERGVLTSPPYEHTVKDTSSAMPSSRGAKSRDARRDDSKFISLAHSCSWCFPLCSWCFPLSVSALADAFVVVGDGAELRLRLPKEAR